MWQRRLHTADVSCNGGRDQSCEIPHREQSNGGQNGQRRMDCFAFRLQQRARGNRCMSARQRREQQQARQQRSKLLARCGDEQQAELRQAADSAQSGRDCNDERWQERAGNRERAELRCSDCASPANNAHRFEVDQLRFGLSCRILRVLTRLRAQSDASIKASADTSAAASASNAELRSVDELAAMLAVAATEQQKQILGEQLVTSQMLRVCCVFSECCRVLRAVSSHRGA